MGSMRVSAKSPSSNLAHGWGEGWSYRQPEKPHPCNPNRKRWGASAAAQRCSIGGQHAAGEPGRCMLSA